MFLTQTSIFFTFITSLLQYKRYFLLQFYKNCLIFKFPFICLQVWFQNRRMKDKRQRIAVAWPYAAVYSDPAFAASILQAAASSVGLPYGYPSPALLPPFHNPQLLPAGYPYPYPPYPRYPYIPPTPPSPVNAEPTQLRPPYSNFNLNVDK